MARKKIIAGNWKMNMTPSEAVKLVETLKPLVVNDEVDVVFCVPAIDIIPVVEAAKGTNIQVGAENMYFEEKGAYTGEISPAMLVDAGVKYVVLGHSERREYFGETNEDVNKKVLKAFEHGITPIMCCGETLTQREQGVTMDFIRQQVKVGFQGVTADQAKTAVIAYEPIWAIGTGKTATTEQAQPIQTSYAEILENDPDIVEIQCNVILEDLEDGVYMSDFLCTKTNNEKMVRECVQRKHLMKPLTVKLLDISRDYWLEQGIEDWGLVINEE